MTNDFNPTKEMIESAAEVFVLKAWVETVKPIVRGYEQRILDDMKPRIDKHWIDQGENDRIINDPEETYLMNGSDFQVYHRRCNEERIKAKLHVDNPEFCPLLVAENKLRKAEDRLIKAMEPITKLNKDMIFQAPNALENYQKLIDLTMGLLAPYISEA